MDWQTTLDNVVAWLLDKGVRIALIIVGAFVLRWALVNLITRITKGVVLSEEEDVGRKKRLETLLRIFVVATTLAVWITAGLLILDQVGIAIGPFLAAAGIAGVAVGFGGQYIIRDLITGVFVILENQYRIGDVVTIDDVTGTVEDITLRTTMLRDLDGVAHHIPHGTIQRVANHSKQFARVNLDIGVSYSSDLDKVIEVINRVGRELTEDPEWSRDIVEPPQFVRVHEFADSAIVVKVLGVVKPLRQWDVAGEFRRRLKRAFDEEGIEIPFPQVVVHKADE